MIREILSEGESARFMDSLNSYVREIRGLFPLNEYVEIESKNPKNSEIRLKD